MKKMIAISSVTVVLLMAVVDITLTMPAANAQTGTQVAEEVVKPEVETEVETVETKKDIIAQPYRTVELAVVSSVVDGFQAGVEAVQESAQDSEMISDTIVEYETEEEVPHFTTVEEYTPEEIMEEPIASNCPEDISPVPVNVIGVNPIVFEEVFPNGIEYGRDTSEFVCWGDDDAPNYDEFLTWDDEEATSNHDEFICWGDESQYDEFMFWGEEYETGEAVELYAIDDANFESREEIEEVESEDIQMNIKQVGIIDAVSKNETRNKIVQNAEEHVGVTPYVTWENRLNEHGEITNSLESGTDCSGFVSLIYQDAGIDAPAGSDVYQEMVNISYEELQPGDIVVYRNGGHVAIYAGDDTIIHCSNEEVGTIESDMFYSEPTGYVRLIEE